MNRTLGIVLGLLAIGTLSWAAPGELVVYPTLADYEAATGNSISSFGEAPILAQRVAAGELREVADRLPDEPLVVDPLEGIGQYGGTFQTGTIGPEIGGFPAESLRWQAVVTVSSDLSTIQPNVIKGWEFNADSSEATFFLRRDMKWSDGAPFTADDWVFWREDVQGNDELTPNKTQAWTPGGSLYELTKVDDYTLELKFAVPYPPVLSYLAARNPQPPYAPKHYLQQYHIEYNAKADEEAKADGFDAWHSAFQSHATFQQNWQDTDLPVLDPWVLSETDSFGNKHYVRNPYFWKIDIAGNQLPYADGITKLLFANREVLDLKIVAGEIDIASRNLPVANFTLYKKGEADGNYRVIVGDGVRGAACAVQINQTVPDPMKRQFFQNEKFKQAMSVAINRGEMNDLLFFGRAVPRQYTTIPSTSYYEDWMGEYYAQYDPALAAQLLDEIGLDKKDADGNRLGPDGKPLTILIETGPWEVYPKIAELIAGYWTDVGIKSTAKTISAALAGEKVRSSDFEAQLQGYAQVSEFLIHPDNQRFRPPWIRNAYPWFQWLNTGGAQGQEPPAEVKEIWDTYELFHQTVPGSEEYMRLGREVLELNVKGLYAIGTVGLEPMPVVIKNYVRNVPSGGIIAWDFFFWTPYQASTFYIEQ